MNSKQLDKFYTNCDVAEACLKTFLEVLKEDHVDPKDFVFLEPSAGSGAFLKALEKEDLKYLAYDIAPESDRITGADFLNLSEEVVEALQNTPLLTIGNPPFGKRSKLAVEFIKTALKYSEYVAFILPIQFQKFLTQKQLPSEVKLIRSDTIDPNSFTIDGRNVMVRSVFQIWSTASSQVDERIRTAPPTKHPDFQLQTYNCTPGALWVLEGEYNFAVLRQGWGDFTPIPHGKSLNPKKQWMTFSSSNPKVVERLKKIDYEKLSEKNTSVRGFGKADVIEEYASLYSPL